MKAVLALSPEAAGSGQKQARLRGVVTYVTASRDDFALHDGEACIPVHVASGSLAPDLGVQVEIEGAVVSEPFFERKRTAIQLRQMNVVGTAPLPEPRRVNIEDVSRFKHLDQWVTLEGTVTQVRASMSLFTIQLVAKAASCNVLVRDWPRDSVPRDWVGGRVRVTGVNRAYLPGSNFLTLVAPSPAQVTLLKPGVVDPLDAPPTTVDAVAKQNPRLDERVKLTGTLLGATTGNVFYAREEKGGAFSFYMLHPIDADTTGRFSTPIIMPKLKPGDVVEVAGIPRETGSAVHLNFGVVRVLRPGPEPAPITADIGTVSAGAHVHDLVEVHGRLLHLDEVLLAPGKWRTTLRLEHEGRRIIAFLDSPARGSLASLQTDHILHLHGIATGPPHFPETRLWVRAPGDIQSLGLAEETLTRRLWTGLAIAAGIVITLTGWVVALRRSRAAVSEQKSTLESRVAERTSELAAAKEDLARALSQERELSELKTRFVSLVSHEFRTPLGVTMSAVELLRHYGDRISREKQAELYEDIHSATLQMSALMEQVLLLGRAEAGKLIWRAAPVDLPELCEKIVDETLSATSRRCPVALKTEGEFQDALMDAALLRHIIGNLLSNAVKYSPAGSPVEFHLSRQGHEAVLTVQDHGIGIPEADQGRLYEAFHRATNVGETPGTGLGLLLVKRCVDLHHGSIHMHSQVGHGTTFTVRVPLSQEKPKA